MMTIEKLLEGLLVKVKPFVICRTPAGPKLSFSALLPLIFAMRNNETD